MAIRYTFQIRCQTDATWETAYAFAHEAIPTTCPVDGGHTVITNATAITQTDRNFPINRDPLVSDDNTLGYVVGDRWTNSTTGAEFFCEDPAAGAAVWQKTSEGAMQGVNYDTAYLSSNVSTSNTNWTDAFSGDSCSPPFDGDYYCIFEAVVSGSGQNGTVEIGVGVNSITTPQADTVRPRAVTTEAGTVVSTTVLAGLVTTDTVHGLFRRAAGNGSVMANIRRISIFRMG